MNFILKILQSLAFGEKKTVGFNSFVNIKTKITIKKNNKNISIERLPKTRHDREVR